ncbi:MAG: hypothetical protein K6L73_01575 [Cellvibrionaceae bacterium]
MHSSLVPETPLLVSPSLAATIGLEEATLLAALNTMMQYRSPQAHNGFYWLQLQQDAVTQLLPFWNPHDIDRVVASLRDKGIILIQSAPFSESQCIHFAFNEQASSTSNLNQPPQQSPTISAQPGSNRIAPNWQPNQEVLDRLSQHNVPPHFAREQLPEFITYWRETGEAHRSWGNKFFKHALRKWEEHRSRESAPQQDAAISRDWQPSADAMEILLRKQIPQNFVDDAVAEFILYWLEKGDRCRTWNSRFMNHVNRQWARFTHALQNDTEPRPIPKDWSASADVYEVLSMANIDIQFAKEQEKEFVIYWRESKQLHSSWNSKFLQHVKYRWAQRHNMPTQQQSSLQQSTRERSINDNLNDRSWAS